MSPTELRQILREAGFCPLPVVGKRPVLEGWQKRTDASRGDIDLWGKLFPDANNTGLLCRLMPTLDIDVHHPDAAEAVEDLVRERFIERGYILVRFGAPPKRAIPFRTQIPFAKITRSLIGPDGSDHKLEFLGDGQHVVVAGVHPTTQRAYSWHGGELGVIKHDDLPYIHLEEAQLLMDDAVELLVREHGFVRQAIKSGKNIAGAERAEAGWAELINNIQAGHELHDALRDLAMKLLAAGMHDGACVNLVRDLLQCSTAARDGRFEERLADIPRAVSTARDKLRQDSKPIALPFINMSGWDTTPLPCRQWAVRERIPMRQPTLFSGEGAVGKTIVELQLCVAHVLGRDWLGAMPEPGPAIYLGAEDEADELRRRLTAIAEHHDATFADLIKGGLHMLSFSGEDALLGVADRQGKIVATPLFDALLKAAQDIRPKHIGLDTCADVFGGNEIDRAHVRQFISLLRKLAIAADGSVVLLSHPSLQGINSGTGLSGSTGWHNSVRARMYLKSPKPEQSAQPDTDLRELTFLKNNYGKVADTVILRFHNGLFIPEAASTLDKLAREQKIEDIFLTVFSKLIEQKRPTGASAHASNYAPAIIANHPDGKGYTRKDYADAMERLFKANRIHIETFGPPSRQLRHLALGPKS